MTEPEPTQTVRFIQYRNGTQAMEEGKIIAEAGVTLTVNGEVWLSWMCTPKELEALAAGFLFNEGIIQSINEIEILRPCENNENVDVWLNHAVEKPRSWRKTSGCTGGITSEEAQKRTAPIKNGFVVAAGSLLRWMDKLFDSQELYRQTRGVHCSMLTDGEKVIAIAEDIGRHNTLDKIAGKLLLEGHQPSRKILLTTGRISSEMLQKAARIGATILISRTSPTSLSIRLAEQLGITLIGYARRNQFNLYTHPQRVEMSGSAENPQPTIVQSLSV